MSAGNWPSWRKSTSCRPDASVRNEEPFLNYLFHLYLSDHSPEGLLGSLMGDFVKGRLDDTYPADIRRGIELHRRIDSFAHGNATVRRSLQRLDPSYRHYRGILVDVFYDHFLARNWSSHADMPLAAFARQVYLALETHHQMLPPGLQRIAPRMIGHNWLESYRDIDTIDTVLGRLATRLSRPNPLASGTEELRRHYQALENDFTSFLPEAVACARRVTASR